MIVIVDYGVGNLSSIQNMLKKAGVDSVISANREVLSGANKLILPGVGAFDTCAEKLQQSGLRELLNEKALVRKTPVLGVCVGMQLLTEGSEEGKLPGLGWIKGNIVRFRRESMADGLKIPHMGWTDVSLAKPSRLFEGMHEEPRFYFVHSYHASLRNQDDVLLKATYGYEFAAALEHENIMGVQFHPEKSHKFGLKLLANFANL